MNTDNQTNASNEDLRKELRRSVGGMFYLLQNKRAFDDFNRAIKKIAFAMVFDPLESRSPSFFLDQIELALKSDVQLSSLWQPYAHSEERTREFLRALAEHIRAELAKPKPPIDNSARLSSEIETHIAKLFTLLSPGFPTNEDIDALAKEIISERGSSEWFTSYEQAIRNALRSNVGLTRLAPPGWKEEELRQYLLYVGHRIQEIWSTKGPAAYR